MCVLHTTLASSPPILTVAKKQEVHLFGGSIGQIPESPETVLDQSLAGVCQVESQSLHASWTKMERKKKNIYCLTVIYKKIFSHLNKNITISTHQLLRWRACYWSRQTEL